MHKGTVGEKLFVTLGAWLVGAPLALLTGAWLTPARAPIWLLPWLFALLAACLARALPAKRRAVSAALMSLPVFALPLLLGLWQGQSLWGVIPAALCVAALLTHLRALTQPRGEEYGVALWYAGIPVYLAARFLAQAVLPEMNGWLAGFCNAYFAYLCFALCERSLQRGMSGGRAPSRLMKARNRAMAALLSLVILALSNLRALKRWLGAAVRGAGRALAWILSLFGRKDGQMLASGGGGDGGENLMELLGGATEPSPFMEVLEQILRAAVAVALLAAAGAALWFAARWLKRAARALLARWRAYAGQVNDAYEETVENLLDWGEVRRAIAEGRARVRQKRQERVPWERLSPRERVRRAYREYLRRHPEVPPYATARQALRGEGQAADIYEQARYSSVEISPEEAERVRESLRQRKGNE